jgi:hypothetical protein
MTGAAIAILFPKAKAREISHQDEQGRNQVVAPLGEEKIVSA